MDIESMQRIIKQLTNEIIDLKKNKGEGKKPFNSFLKKKTNTYSPPQIHHTSGINLEDYAMENYCYTHHANQLERSCLEFINSFTAMLVPPKPPKKDNKNEKEEDYDEQWEEEEEPPYHFHMIWDEAKVDNDDDDIMEEACVAHDYNIHSKQTLKSNDLAFSLETVAKNTPTIAPLIPKKHQMINLLIRRRRRRKNKLQANPPLAWT